MTLLAPLTDEECAVFIASARSFLDVPFRHRGRSERGVDCIGVVGCALASVGRWIADRNSYGKDPVRDGLPEAMEGHLGRPIDPAEMRVADILLMGWHELPNHVAIVTDYPLGGFAILHALKANGRVIEHRLAGPWPRRIRAVYRP